MQFWVAPGGEVGFTVVDSLLLTVSRDGRVPDSAWEAYLRALAEAPPVVATLTYAPKTVLSVWQRHYIVAFAERMERDVIKYNAVLTNSSMLRGSIIALSWFFRGSQYRAFPPSELSLALDWLQTITSFDRREIIDALHRLQRRVRLEKRQGHAAPL